MGRRTITSKPLMVAIRVACPQGRPRTYKGGNAFISARLDKSVTSWRDLFNKRLITLLLEMTLQPTPIAVKPSAQELRDGKLSQRNLEIAIRALARDGLVVLEDLVESKSLDKLNEKMVQDAYHLQSQRDSPFNYNKGNIQQDPPMTAEYFDESIYTSK